MADKIKYLDFVMLTEEEYAKLVELCGKFVLDELMEDLNNYIGSKGKRYKSHYFTLRAWYRKRKPDRKPPIDIDAFARRMGQ